MTAFIPGAQMKRTGQTCEVAAIGQLEAGQERNLSPEYSPPDKKSGKGCEPMDMRYQRTSSLILILKSMNNTVKTENSQKNEESHN